MGLWWWVVTVVRWVKQNQQAFQWGRHLNQLAVPSRGASECASAWPRATDSQVHSTKAYMDLALPSTYSVHVLEG